MHWMPAVTSRSGRLDSCGINELRTHAAALARPPGHAVKRPALGMITRSRNPARQPQRRADSLWTNVVNANRRAGLSDVDAHTAREARGKGLVLPIP